MCIYDQNLKGNIRFMKKISNHNDMVYGLSSNWSRKHHSELDPVYDPIIENFRYSICVENMDHFMDYFNSRIPRGKPYIYYGYLNRIDSPRNNLEIQYSIKDRDIEFDISGGLYNLFCVLLLIQESNNLSKNDPKFKIDDRVLTNFGKAFIYDYILDIKNNEIEYVCGVGDYRSRYDDSIEYRSIPSSHIKFDRDHKIDKILK